MLEDQGPLIAEITADVSIEHELPHCARNQFLLIFDQLNIHQEWNQFHESSVSHMVLHKNQLRISRFNSKMKELLKFYTESAFTCYVARISTSW